MFDSTLLQHHARGRTGDTTNSTLSNNNGYIENVPHIEHVDNQDANETTQAIALPSVGSKPTLLTLSPNIRNMIFSLSSPQDRSFNLYISALRRPLVLYLTASPCFPSPVASILNTHLSFIAVGPPFSPPATSRIQAAIPWVCVLLTKG